ncbi:MAG: hypothetical protein F4X39_10960 [Acidobacteriia bacterium]|nr:hypothetical protein [Terriglobia bacterium]
MQACTSGGVDVERGLVSRNVPRRSAMPAPPARSRLARISHHPTVEARHMTVMTSLRLLAVLNVLFKYACARQATRAFFLRPACA